MDDMARIWAAASDVSVSASVSWQWCRGRDVSLEMSGAGLEEFGGDWRGAARGRGGGGGCCCGDQMEAGDAWHVSGNGAGRGDYASNQLGCKQKLRVMSAGNSRRVPYRSRCLLVQVTYQGDSVT
jgi:hypothetical protein